MSSSSTIGGNGTTVNNTPTDTMNANSSNTSAADLQQTFLTLLVTQLQNQDPTSPVDSSQMTSQLAQINTVSGIAQLNSSLSSLSSQITAGQQTQAAMLVGSNVLAPGNTLSLSGGATTAFGVQLSTAASNLTITVTNSAGQVVNTINEGAQQAGTVPFTWTPTDSTGAKLPDGNYTIKATYTDSSGNTASATTMTVAQVQGVIRQADGTPGLALSNGTTVGLSAIGAIFPSASASNGSGSGSGSGSDSSNNNSNSSS
ncbi:MULTISPECIES: flagellar hook assembly protein FlgD [Burkholderia]|uniref:flagellar hook assembly protein FlgD n=1 Tax=Burkholderia TaxID=32008 RepID=UPI00050FBB06|nr:MULTISPECIES: flagellar hook assembly protein FlgD [Burkholderia]AYQ86630.1 flagellar hook assembly protein FlgD [Burkholderia gladioli]KGE09147.1 flagellar basal body rod modification protein FlgD [Burkholderia gladioli]KVM64024.1 flagellar biosynthesis protein FlgD [Burkholderia gladioli]NBI47804.1 flagellar hook assembly protein FlgD [Burkholderia sp. ISTR5]